MAEENQYQTPSSNVEQSGQAEYGEVKLFSISGRIGRVRYIAYNFGLIFALMLFIMIATFTASFGMSGEAGMSIAGIIMMVVMVAGYGFVLVVSFMLTIQRAHDFNASGWLSLITLVPLASLIFLFIPGTDGENNYGLKTPPNGAATAVVIILVLLVPIAGIVAAIAIPAYQGYIQKVEEMKINQQN